MAEHTKGAIKAANRLKIRTDPDWVMSVIDEETHSAEMLEFIERVADWDFEGDAWDTSIEDAKKKAENLLDKIRG